MTEVIHEIGDAELHAAQAVPATVEADGRLDAKAVFRDICHARHLPSEGTLFQLVHSHRCLEANHPAVDMVGKQTHINADDGFARAVLPARFLSVHFHLDRCQREKRFKRKTTSVVIDIRHFLVIIENELRRSI